MTTPPPKQANVSTRLWRCGDTCVSLLFAFRLARVKADPFWGLARVCMCLCALNGNRSNGQTAGQFSEPERSQPIEATNNGDTFRTETAQVFWCIHSHVSSAWPLCRATGCFLVKPLRMQFLRKLLQHAKGRCVNVRAVHSTLTKKKRGPIQVPDRERERNLQKALSNPGCIIRARVCVCVLVHKEYAAGLRL